MTFARHISRQLRDHISSDGYTINLMQDTKPTYRVIERGDTPALFEVRIATWHNDHGQEELTQMGITPESVSALLHTTHRGWVCEMGGQIVGFSMSNRETAEMWVIAVLKAYEGRGIGRALLTLAEDWLFEQGHEEAWLTTDPDERFRAVGFYRHCGWRDWKSEHGDRYMKKSRPKHG